MSATTNDQKSEGIVNAWLSATEALNQRQGAPPTVPDQPGPLLLVLNLTHLNVKSLLNDVKGASEETLKTHKGIRANVAIVKVLSPGFSSVPTDADAAPAAKKGGKFQGRASVESKEKLSTMSGEYLHMHSYELVNKKGVYTRCGRTPTYAKVSPGK